jgi:hypothetical protein
VGVNWISQIATPGFPLAPSTQPESSANDAPAVGELNATVPVGVIGPPAEASETVAVHTVEAVTATGEGEHVKLVVLARGATWIAVPAVPEPMNVNGAPP